MSLLLQQLLVGVLVIACALFAAWRLSSVRLRRLCSGDSARGTQGASLATPVSDLQFLEAVALPAGR